MEASEDKTVWSRLPKREEGLAAGKTIWQYADARIDQIVENIGDIDFLVSHSTFYSICPERLITYPTVFNLEGGRGDPHFVEVLRVQDAREKPRQDSSQRLQRRARR